MDYGLLYQPTEDDKKQALNMGLLNFAAGMLSGPSYGSFGRSLGNGIGAGIGGYQDALQQQQLAYRNQLQAQMWKAQQDRYARQDDMEAQKFQFQKDQYGRELANESRTRDMIANLRKQYPQFANIPDDNLMDFVKSQYRGPASPPAGYRYTQNGDLAYIPGGPADPSMRSTTAPSGYRFTPNGGLEPIPGGPAAAEADKIRAASDNKAQMVTGRANTVVSKVDEALKNVDWSTTGFVGNFLKEIGGTDARDLKGTLDTIKANIGFNELQQMREASPTGGALGQVAVQELNMLQATLSSLDQAQTGPQVKQSLDAIKKHFSNWKAAVDEANGVKNTTSTTGAIRRYNPQTGKIE